MQFVYSSCSADVGTRHSDLEDYLRRENISVTERSPTIALPASTFLREDSMKIRQVTLALTLLLSASVAGQDPGAEDSDLMIGDPSDQQVETDDIDVVGDPAAGFEKAKSLCAACHGLDGNAFIAEYPDLAGQNAEYLAYALRAYQSRQRFGGNAGIMIPQADGLSAQDIADLAAYYASLED